MAYGDIAYTAEAGGACGEFTSLQEAKDWLYNFGYVSNWSITGFDEDENEVYYMDSQVLSIGFLVGEIEYYV